MGRGPSDTPFIGVVSPRPTGRCSRHKEPRPTGGHDWYFIGSLVWLFGAAAESQVPASRTLPPASQQLAEEFSEIVSVRELPNGTLLIADRLEKRIVSARLPDGSIRIVGARGQGPGEYGGVFPILSLGGDSSLMADLTGRRWVLFRGDQIDRTIPPDHPAVAATRGRAISADTLGHVLARALTPLDQRAPRDSIDLIRVSMATGAVEVVGRLRAPPTQIRTAGNVEGRPETIQFTFTIMETGEDAVLFPDGWLAIARLEPYRVEWRDPEGRIVLGPELPFPLVPVDAREKQAYRDRRTALRGRPDRTPDNANWPATIPPFLEGSLVPLPSGHLLIMRTPTADNPGNDGDIIDRRGHLVSRLRLPPNERIVGVGTQSLYVAVTRDDGLQVVRQHPVQ